MNSWPRRTAAFVIALACSVAQAQSSKGLEPSGIEAQVAARFTEKSGGQKPDQVFKGPGGLYELLVGGEFTTSTKTLTS
jgi:hypothetical protein